MRIQAKMRRARGHIQKAFLIASTVLIGSVAAASPGWAEVVKLKLISAWPFEGAAGIKMLIPKMFIEEFNKRAKGKAEITFVGGSEVVSPFDQLKALRDGQFDMMVSTSLYFKDLRDIQFYHYIPYEAQNEGMKQGYKLMQEISRKKAEVIFVGLCCSGHSFRLWTRTKQIRTAADAAGLKIRTFGDTTRPLHEHLKIAPVNIPSNDVYSALANGLIDGTIRETLSLDVLKEADFLKFGTQEIIADINGESFISARTWDKLSPEVQQTMNEVARWSEQEGYARMEKIVAETFARIQKEKGVTVLPSDPKLVDALRHVRNDIIGKILAGSPWKDKIIEQFKLKLN